MNDRLRRSGLRFFVAVCLAVATMLVGFAHRPLPGFARGEDLVADGGVAFGSFCTARIVVSDEAGVPKTRIAFTICDACLIFSAPGLGAVAEVVLPLPLDRPLDRLVAAETAASSRVAPTATARGPPALA